MLDYDGTLAPFHRERMNAVPYAGVREALVNLLQAGHTHLAVVSGRPIAELDRLLQPPSGIDVWGSHGWERRTPAGDHTIWPISGYAMEALTQAEDRIRPFVPDDSIEVKTGAVVIHTRALDGQTHARIGHAVVRQWEPLIDSAEGIEMREFNKGFEFRVTTRTKATVVETLVSELPRGTHFAYIGDDYTDEDAFAALPKGGWPILACPAPRESRAQWRLTTPDGVLRFLQDWTSQFR